MNELMAIMNHESHNNPLAGDIFLLKLLFNLYEECDIIKADDMRSNQDQNLSITTSTFGTPDQIGIRLEDIVEAVSCASCSIEEQMKMNKLGNKIVQYFFDGIKKKDLSFDRPLAKSKPRNDYLERELKENAAELRNSGLRSGKLTYNYYGEVAKTADLKSKREKDAVKFGFPLPYSHLSHLGSTNININTNTDNDTIAKKDGARSFDTDGDDSVTSQSLFLGGRSEWSEHSFHQENLGNERENTVHRLAFDDEFESEEACNQGLKDLKAEKFLSYPKLRSIKKFPKISQNELINCICNIYPEVLEEFSNQTKKYRFNFILFFPRHNLFKIIDYILTHNF